MLALVEYGCWENWLGDMVVGFSDGCHCLDDEGVSVSLA